ncbi:hypothetical protein IKG60_02015 [Candidatus Saccharibacteria bacterium]|nr:hypothetical protein [Candidatus Saccharibacteria bacterium]
MKKRGRIKFHRVKTWQLLLILIPLLFIDATLLRMDHIKMTELRDAVLEADAAENDDGLTKALEELRQFTLSNVVVNVVDDNGAQRVTFGTGPFYLEHTYLRAANQALEEAEKQMVSDENPNGNVYAMASETCKAAAIANGWTWDNPNYINCMVSEIQKYPAADEIQDKIKASLPSTELYRREFAAPVWAPTLTGFMILLTLIIVIVIMIRGIVWLVLRLALIFV